ncbi:MAG: EamA family transporter [Dongiaceae bacterium]
MRPIHFLLAMLVPASWGLGLTVGKAGLAEMPPLLLMSFRFGVTALALVWFVRIPRGALLKLCGIAVFGCTLQYGLTFTGMKFLDVATTTLVIHLEVPFGVIAAALLLKERIGWRRALGIAIAFGGLVVMYGAPSIQANPIPALMVVGGALTWAIGQVLIKKVGNLGGFVTIAWLAKFAAPQLFVASLLIENGQWQAVRDATWVGWSAILYMGVIMTAGAYALWYHLLGLYRVNQVMPFLLLIPIASILSAMLMLGEIPPKIVLLGGAIIMVGVAAIVIEPSAWRRPKETATPPESSVA